MNKLKNRKRLKRRKTQFFRHKLSIYKKLSQPKKIKLNKQKTKFKIKSN